jgi:hypothetical protein
MFVQMYTLSLPMCDTLKSHLAHTPQPRLFAPLPEFGEGPGVGFCTAQLNNRILSTTLYKVISAAAADESAAGRRIHENKPPPFPAVCHKPSVAMGCVYAPLILCCSEVSFAFVFY